MQQLTSSDRHERNRLAEKQLVFTLPRCLCASPTDCREHGLSSSICLLCLPSWPECARALRDLHGRRNRATRMAMEQRRQVRADELIHADARRPCSWLTKLISRRPTVIVFLLLFSIVHSCCIRLSVRNGSCINSPTSASRSTTQRSQTTSDAQTTIRPALGLSDPCSALTPLPSPLVRAPCLRRLQTLAGGRLRVDVRHRRGQYRRPRRALSAQRREGRGALRRHHAR